MAPAGDSCSFKKTKTWLRSTWREGTREGVGGVAEEEEEEEEEVVVEVVVEVEVEVFFFFGRNGGTPK